MVLTSAHSPADTGYEKTIDLLVSGLVALSTSKIPRRQRIRQTDMERPGSEMRNRHGSISTNRSRLRGFFHSDRVVLGW